MSDTVQACPACDSTSKLHKLIHEDRVDSADVDEDYKCYSCGHAFDEPVTREARNTNTLRGLARELDRADPDQVGDAA
ncbi:hypothetical protein EGH21_22380 [Halomicroarcula sp. F13]|uniref:Uncharacterized protein n=1 Tax=Haloarcula rubra TaxID=2487747 RepID=A0AAW4PZX2_9EURY|nr:hypothetical protein [Halomicroarcula rubra]MBX0325768.1 hypothetical protein [Halomicroarcula rubra]